MAEPMDPILFQDKGVFQTNVYELVRAHQAVANRFLAAEKKLKDINVGDGSDFSALKKQVTDLGGGLDGLKVAMDALKKKVTDLFPDEGGSPPADPAPVDAPPADVPPATPAPVDPAPATPAPADVPPAV
jgi:hypothetical protein